MSDGAERWRAIAGLEGSYEVSDRGRVRSLDRTLSTLRGTSRRRGMVMKPRAKESGHLSVSLGVAIPRRLVHRLVLEAFVGTAPEGMEGCHNDGNPANNRLENLRWDTRSANQLDRVRHGGRHNAVKTHCKWGHEFAEQNLVAAKLPWRECRTCKIADSKSRFRVRSGGEAITDLEVAQIYLEVMELRRPARAPALR